MDYGRLVEGAITYYDKVRLSALKNDVGGRWLVDDRGAAEMLPEEWNYGARLRLGVTILPSIAPGDEPGLCQLCAADGVVCRQTMDHHGLHAMCCGSAGHRIRDIQPW